MERDVGYKRLYNNSLVDCFNVVFSTQLGQLILIYAYLCLTVPPVSCMQNTWKSFSSIISFLHLTRKAAHT